MRLNEGGNIFKGPDGSPVTQRIKREDVEPTIEWLEKITGLPHKDFTLGTTGKKATSGDLDIAVNQEEVDKKELAVKLAKWVKENYPNEDPKEWVKKSGNSVHFKTPIRGDVENGFVQTDLMFGEPDWMKFTHKGTTGDSPFKGSHRAIMMSSIAKANGLKWSPKEGLVSRTSGKVVSKNPDEIAEMLLGPTADRSDLDSVESMLNKIKTLPNYDELVADAREAFKREGLELPESVQVGTGSWFREMMERLS